MENYTKYFQGIVSAASENGMESCPDEPFEARLSRAALYLREREPLGHVFIHVELSDDDGVEEYTFSDPVTGFPMSTRGNFRDAYGKADDVYFVREKDGSFSPVSWRDIPACQDARKDYIFVFNKEVLGDGRIAYLYDYLK